MTPGAPGPDRVVQFKLTSATTGVICAPSTLPLNLALVTINEKEAPPAGCIWELDASRGSENIKVPCPDESSRVHYNIRLHRSASGAGESKPRGVSRTARLWATSPNDWDN